MNGEIADNQWYDDQAEKKSGQRGDGKPLSYRAKELCSNQFICCYWCDSIELQGVT